MALRLLSRRIRTFTRLREQCNSRAYSAASTLNQDEQHADIVISGGGMVGTAMACALAHNKLLDGKRIVLLEMAPDPGEFTLPEQYSNRTCALSPSTVQLLSGFGAWQEIESLRHHPVLRMQVWESCSDSMISFNNSDMTESLAYIVENSVISAGLLNALKSAGDRVEILYQSKCTSIHLPGGEDSTEVKQPYVRLELNDGRVLKTKLLIGADGMYSQVRKTAGFHTIKREYDQSAVVATLILGDTMSNNTAWQRFLPTGPIALLPLSDNVSSLVWSTTNENAKHLQELPSDSFVDAVNDAFWHERDKSTITGQALDVFKKILQNVVPDEPGSVRQLPPTVVDIVEGSHASFPLTLIHSSQYVSPRVALIGDAGHRLHPLAGQGVNLGFGDVQSLSDILGKAVRSGADLGSLTHLLQYETERQRHNVPVMLVIDGLQRLYSTDFTPLVLIRSLGLHGTHSIPFIKKMIINRASI